MLCCSGNGCSELAETMHYCIGILTFLTNLDSFIKWGDWKAFFITLSAEKIFFLLIPFLMVFIPCWIGQEAQNRVTDTFSDEQEEQAE